MSPADLIISEEVIAQEVSGETVLLDLKSEQYFSLDEVGTCVWQMLGAGNSLAEIRAALLKEYDVSPQELNRDLDALLQSLLKEGLVSPTADRV